MVSISPMPSPDYDAPSPEADEMELELPEDTTPTREGGADTPEPPPQDLNSRLHSMMNEHPESEVSFQVRNIEWEGRVENHMGSIPLRDLA